MRGRVSDLGGVDDALDRLHAADLRGELFPERAHGGNPRRAVGPDRPLTKMHLEGRVDLLELLALLELRATRRIAPILFFPGRR